MRLKPDLFELKQFIDHQKAWSFILLSMVIRSILIGRRYSDKMLLEEIIEKFCFK